MDVLKTQNLTKSFGELTAVDSMSITVQAGEVFGLLGPNGAGKTTAVKMLTTLLPPTSGDAWVAGFDIVHHAAEIRRVIGYVPQAISADGTLTGYENLLIFAKLHDIPRQERASRIQEALDFMGIADSAHRLVREYSGGMIRRLEIAQSILHRPQVLFLDEPTVGLDPSARRIVWEHLENLRAEYGTTIFMTTHLMDEADAFCSRLAIMNLGKVAVTGTPVQVKASIGKDNATMDDAFIYYTGGAMESTGGYREATRTRRTARRLG
ncbi:MAG: ATP-binding cassette domain-containing protein [Armatimonadota bacterium]|nr:ATP-binding cassette domain-containing protein [Armatimonadota bacterium]